jgi:hypothetical protein
MSESGGLSPRPQGPWDISETAPERPRIDLGSLRIPGVPDMELRVEADQATGAIAGVSAVIGDAVMQLAVYAAPRTSGIWEDVRGQLMSSLAGQGATTDLEDGEFGPELVAKVSGQKLRFIGVDGPRWFLRAVLQGSALGDATGERMRSLLRDCIIVRGDSPMAPGDGLPLSMPMAADADADADADTDIDAEQDSDGDEPS